MNAHTPPLLQPDPCSKWADIPDMDDGRLPPVGVTALPGKARARSGLGPHGRVSAIAADWPSDDCCDLCCATPVRTELDGDKLCQTCADKWVRSERPEPAYEAASPRVFGGYR